MGLSRFERLALILLLVIFTCFTWRGITMFFSGDDMMNMYGAWNTDPWTIAKGQLLLWIPLYRPVGTAVYRIFYESFGFHPAPLYTFCWILLLTNVVIAYYLLRELTGDVTASLIALALVLVHGSFGDLYYSAGNHLRPALLLLHGDGVNRLLPLPPARRLDAFCSALYPGNLGHGIEGERCCSSGSNVLL